MTGARRLGHLLVCLAGGLFLAFISGVAFPGALRAGKPLLCPAEAELVLVWWQTPSGRGVRSETNAYCRLPCGDLRRVSDRALFGVRFLGGTALGLEAFLVHLGLAAYLRSREATP